MTERAPDAVMLSRRRKAWVAGLLGVALAVMLAAAWHSGWLALAYYQVIIPTAPPGAKDRLPLAEYRVGIEARPLEGIQDDASGLTYHPGRKSLFTVLNQPAQIVELDLQGKILRRISVRGASDLEGITHVEGNYFVIADEQSHRLHLVEIPDGTREIDVARAPGFGLAIGMGKRANVGYEGVSWDHLNHRLWVAKEKQPMRVFAISGWLALRDAQRFNLQIDEWQPAGSARLMMTDLSSLTYHEPTGHLLLLSDESRLLVEFDADGNPAGMLVLRGGWHGLGKTVPQAEGVAVGAQGEIYVLSEPNLFYRFDPPGK